MGIQLRLKKQMTIDNEQDLYELPDFLIFLYLN
jgi:hypothetical protein